MLGKERTCSRLIGVAVEAGANTAKRREKKNTEVIYFFLNTNYVRLSARLTTRLLWFSKLTVFELILELKLGA